MVPRTLQFAKQLLWSVAIQIWSGCICSVLHKPLQAPRKWCWPQKVCLKRMQNMSNLIKCVATLLPQFWFSWTIVLKKCIQINCPSEACTRECRSARHTTLASRELQVTGHGTLYDALYIEVWSLWSSTCSPFCCGKLYLADAWVALRKQDWVQVWQPKSTYRGW